MAANVNPASPLVSRLLPSRPGPAQPESGGNRTAEEGGTRIVRGACPHDCPDTCALLVTVEDGRVTRVAGDPDHPSTHGSLCTKVSRYAERTHSPDRLLQPMRRVGRKGSGAFEAISWDAALDEIAGRLGAIAARDPQRILPYSYAGTMGLVQGESMAARFFNRLGSSLLDRTICSAAGKAGLTYTLGGAVGMDVERFAESKLIILWGTNSITSNLHFWTFAQQAKRLGAKLIAIDPHRTATAEKCHQHVALLPGTDAALALGLVASLARQGLLDHDYIRDHTLGFEALLERAVRWTPERVAGVCGIDAAVVDELACDYGTLAPAAIRLNYGMQRVRGGANAARLIAGLPALVGAWRHPSGGMLLSSSGDFTVDWRALQRPDLTPAPLRDRRRVVNMSTIGDALLEADPPIEALVVYNSNPVAVAPDSSKVIRGFEREDLFTVVLDHFRTDTADMADILLPATTQLEHLDIHTSYGHRYWMLNQPAIAPLGEALPNSEIFRRLAGRMGFDEPCFADSDLVLAAQAVDRTGRTTPQALRRDGDSHVGSPLESPPGSSTGSSLESSLDDEAARSFLSPLLAQGWLKMDLAAAPFADGNFPTPSGKVEFYSSRLAQAGEDPLPDYLPPYESAASNPELAARFPLAMISPPARNFLNSTFANVESLKAAEKDQQVHINPADARPRDIQDGQMVTVFNDRGSFSARAVLTASARPGVVMVPGVWWHKHSPGGRNVNMVTHQRLTDLGRGPSFYDCLVEIEAR
jgi:anaerobic selenocysteine-containing dehydrogenase